MELFEGHVTGSLIFSAILTLVVFFAAWRNRFFRLPPLLSTNPMTLLRVIGAFFVYFLFAILLPIAALFSFRFFFKEYANVFALPTDLKGYLQFGFLSILFILLISYCYLIGAGVRRFIFWGEGIQSVSRFLKSFGMGMVGWVISYPCVLLVGLLANLIAVFFWGEIEVEQVAVMQLKKTMEYPLLFGLMIFAVVVLVPFMEELLFRGFLQTLLRKYLKRGWALFLTALIFALVHFSASQGKGNFQLISTLFVLSLFLGFLYEREQSLWASIGLHVTFNGFSVILLILSAGG
ncbi:MAG: hypothetical protein S4CHLAM123_02390 [Chlamydiales bacterium]|nr:hypothetical protein [Chlamydiales bacterium]